MTAGPEKPGADIGSPLDWSEGGVVLAFLNEVAGGRKLLAAIRERAEAGADGVAVVAPQNQPMAGQIVDRDELREAAQSRVDVTMKLLAEFGIDSGGAVLDHSPALSLDDAVRAFEPREVLLSCLYETRFGFLRRDLVEWARERLEVPVTHVPVRIRDDAISWGVTHTVVVATRTVASAELVDRLKRRHAESPQRYTIISPPSGGLERAEVCERLARALSELYRADIDATGQPMSPEPFAAVKNAIEHYRVDEILISTLAGERSQWLEEGLIDRVREITDKPVEHVEAAEDARPARARTAGGVGAE